MTTPTPSDIRAVLIQTEAARLLLPNATISEVLSYADPEPVESAPGWLLGTIRWRGWRLPLVAFAPLIGHEAEVGGLGPKVVVLKTLGGQPTMPYFACSAAASRWSRCRASGCRRWTTRTCRVGPACAPWSCSTTSAVIPDIDGIELSLRQALAA